MVDAAPLNHARLRRTVGHLREYGLVCCVVFHLVFIFWSIFVYVVLPPIRGEMVARRTTSPDWSAPESHVGFEEQRVCLACC